MRLDRVAAAPREEEIAVFLEDLVRAPHVDMVRVLAVGCGLGIARWVGALAKIAAIFSTARSRPFL
jgi:hypothetical protein